MPRLILTLVSLLSVLWLSSAGHASEPAPRKLMIFLLAGQSNMAGRGPVEALDQSADPRILVFRNGGWAPATEPLHNDKPKVAGVGPGLAFARALLPHLPADVSIGLIPAAFGGTRIEWWARDYRGNEQRWPDGSTLYANAVSLSRLAAKDGTLAGILWNQGESNVASARADGGEAYRRALAALVAHLREDLASPTLPFVAATLGPWQEQNAPEINAVLRAVPEFITHSAVVDTLASGLKEHLRAKVNDPIHYDSPSARLLGERYAAAMRPLLKTVP